MSDPGLGPFYSGVEALERHEPWSPRSARARLEGLRPQLAFDVSVPELVPSDNNDVWRLKDAYLRVAWRGDLDRLGREARLLEALRGVVPVPEVLAHGRSDTLSWSLQRAVPGRPLGEAVGGAGGRDLFRQAVEGLRALHAWSVPEGLASDLTPGAGPVRDRIGWELVVLPRVGVLDLVELTRRAPHADPRVLDQLAQRVEGLPDVAPGAPSLLHGDFYLGNVLVHEGGLSGFIDFEFARRGPVDLELVSAVRALDAERRLGIHRPPVLEWLRQDYPEAFAHPDLGARLWLYAISYALRQALFWPADRAESAGLDLSHPLHSLRRLVQAPLPLG